MERWLKWCRDRMRLAAVLASAVALTAILSSRTAGPSFDSRSIFESVYRVENSSGSVIGTAFSVRGGFITAWHVVDGEKGMSLVSARGVKAPVSSVRGNKVYDVAMVSADLPGLQLDVQDERYIYRGMRVWAVGHTFGMPYMVSDGVVSMLGYFPPGVDARRWSLVVTAWVGGGNSGGPVIDERGKVVGMVQSFIFSVGTGQTHITICAPASELRRLMDEFPVP